MKTREMLQRIRMCNLEALRHNIPFCCAMERTEYWTYFDSEIMYALPYDYVGIIEQHEDWYYHSVPSKKLAEKIVADGTLRVKFSSKDNSCGKAVYTFPCNSGRVANMWGDAYVIKFKSSQKHVHLINVADDTNKPLGECVFFEDVVLEDVKVMPIEDAIADSKVNYTKCAEVMPHYYGVKADKPLLEDLPDFLMDKVINKPSFWVAAEKTFSNYDRKTYEGMLKRIELYEMQKENNVFDSFYHTDLDFFRYHVKKALSECKEDVENMSTMNLF